MVRVRVRQHVNPLADKYTQPLIVPDWASVYTQAEQPLHLDIGCGWGGFLLHMASQNPDWNFLGLEIRQPLVEVALGQAAGIGNLHYLFTNVNANLEMLLASLPAGVLRRVTIQFPDPWFKKRHAKRRVVQPDLVAIVDRYLAADGWVFLQSDVAAVLEHMIQEFTAHPNFQVTSGLPQDTPNPFSITTERERSTLSRGLPVYRAVLDHVLADYSS